MKRVYFFFMAVCFFYVYSASASIKDGHYLFYGKDISSNKTQGLIQLRDEKRALIHEWKVDHYPFNAKLMPNGDVIVLSMDTKLKSHLVIPTPYLERYSWDGKKTWSYKNKMMHHDFEVLPNGNIAVLIWEKLPNKFLKQIKGGYSTPYSLREMYADAVIEVDKAGKVVWQWSVYKNLDINKNKIAPYHNRDEWTHGNSIHYIKKNPVDGTPGYLLSFRSLNQVMIMSKSTGKIIWQSPQKIFSAQHDASLTKSGKILVFDNGLDTINSRVAEMDLKSKQVIWSFDGGDKISSLQFFTSVMGAVQKLEKDRYLVTNSLWGQFFIVNRNGDVAERFFSPFKQPKEKVWPYQFMFKLRMYPPPQPLIDLKKKLEVK